MKLAIIGAGAWGTALACVLTPRFDEVRLWYHGSVNETIPLPSSVLVSNDFETVLRGADIVISAMPSHVVREICVSMRDAIPAQARIVSATKGLEAGTELRISQVIRSVLGERPVGVLSGPTFAAEVAAAKPAAAVIASDNPALVEEVQAAFSGPTFRVYGTSDVIGVEIGGALKNVIAIGAGISDGLGLGHNAIAALITRGLAELTRLAVAEGARAETLFGLAGLGDLVLTCTGDLSRNRQVGLKLAAGQPFACTKSVAEGVKTCEIALKRARKWSIFLPITQEMDAVLNHGLDPAVAINRLMGRALRLETIDARKC